MSGTLPQYRPGSKPAFDYLGDERVPLTRTKVVTRPGGVYKNGRCVEWRHVEVTVPVYVLDHAKPADRPSKHARGRIRPRTRKEQQRMASLMRRATQARKSMTVDINRLGVIYDEFVGP